SCSSHPKRLHMPTIRMTSVVGHRTPRTKVHVYPLSRIAPPMAERIVLGAQDSMPLFLDGEEPKEVRHMTAPPLGRDVRVPANRRIIQRLQLLTLDQGAPQGDAVNLRTPIRLDGEAIPQWGKRVAVGGRFEGDGRPLSPLQCRLLHIDPIDPLAPGVGA